MCLCFRTFFDWIVTKFCCPCCCCFKKDSAVNYDLMTTVEV